METLNKIKKILESYTPEYGFAAYEHVLPLLECRAKSRLPADAKTVIICLFPYYLPEQEGRNLSRYAIVEDYHIVAGKRLEAACEELEQEFPLYHFVPFVDNSPIREVEAAVSAGLGVRGKNQLLIHPQYGSYVFLGEIVTDLKIGTERSGGACIGCEACIRACPGGAITENGIDRERCLSHITQKKGQLTPEEENLIRKGKLLWGCDVCQEVCPCNRDLPVTSVGEFCSNVVAQIPYDQIDELVKTRAFGFRGSQVIKRNFRILQEEAEQQG